MVELMFSLGFFFSLERNPSPCMRALYLMLCNICVLSK